MTTIVETVRVDEVRDKLWKEIGHFGAVGSWHPLLSRVESDGERQGSIRIPEDRDGNRQTERLLEVSAEQYFYRYRMESTALPVRDWIAELRAADNRDGTTTVIWSAEFEPIPGNPSAVEGIRAFMKAGLDNIARLHERT